jgi:hypothetical protein
LGNYYKGRYKVKNPHKYIGDVNNVVYRSSWERAAFKWLDENEDIVQFGSEEIIVPYVCGTDNKVHRYFVDLFFKTKEGKMYLIEIKPKKELTPPKNPGKRTRKYIKESLTYVKNQSKWKAANEYALDHGMVFQVWTEETLKSLGISILGK